MLSKPAGGKQPSPQPWPSPPEMPPYRRIWGPISGAYASDWLGTMPQASEYAFLREWSSLKPLNSPVVRRWWWWISPRHQSFLRALDQLMAGEKHIRLLGASSPIDQVRRSTIFGLSGGPRGPFLAAAAMVMRVLLAVGRWPLVAWCFCRHKSYIIVGIVWMYIPNVFFPV
jgi:hypothetical protein